jgi:micrococcal nuclease
LIILNKTYSIWIPNPPDGQLHTHAAMTSASWFRVVGVIAVLLLTGFAFCQVQAGEADVRFVLDGDTILLRSGEKVRYLGIDAPELVDGKGKGEPLSHASRDFSRHLLEGRSVRLTCDRERRDHYGRLLAYVYLLDGRMVNALVLQKGLAVVMVREPNIRYRDFLLACQREAMRKRIGLWERIRDRKDEVFEGNIQSFRFHRKDCAYLARVPKRERIRFQSLFEAFWAGYNPCKRCRPAD